MVKVVILRDPSPVKTVGKDVGGHLLAVAVPKVSIPVAGDASGP
jgi:hypothetical protein